MALLRQTLTHNGHLINICSVDESHGKGEGHLKGGWDFLTVTLGPQIHLFLSYRGNSTPSTQTLLYLPYLLRHLDPSGIQA